MRITRKTAPRSGARPAHRWCRAACAVVLLAACRGEPQPKRETAAAAPAVQAAAPSVPVLGPLATPAAFDLVATPDGALVAWAEPGACDTSLRLQRLDPDGRALGKPRPGPASACAAAALGAESGVVELALATGGSRTGLVWIVQSRAAAALVGTYGSDGLSALAPAQRVADLEPSGAQGRGRVALVASHMNHLRVAYQAPAQRCRGRDAPCSQLYSQPFPSLDPEADRGGGAREIEVPCTALHLGARYQSGNWYDAFCALKPGADGAMQALAQVYAIRPEISYAEAVETLRGCEPVGLSPAERGVVLWGYCDGALRAHTVAYGAAERVLDRVTRRVACVQGRPQLRAESEDGTLTLALDEPLSLLQGWLPETLVSPSSRAVFTGRRLLVATPSHDLTLVTYVCRGDELVPEAAPLL